MTINAKPVLKDKFWIVEQDNQRVGTLSWNDDRYIFSSSAETCFFDNTKQMKKKFGTDVIFVNNSTITEQILPKENNIHGFPTSVTPHNSMYDVKRKLPLFTKSEKSKSMYCAGYYVIQFEKGWVKSFCPKLITVERYNTHGPFKTELEMRQELSRVNK